MTSWDVLQQILVTVGIGLACEEKGGEVARGRGLRLFIGSATGSELRLMGLVEVGRALAPLSFIYQIRFSIMYIDMQHACTHARCHLTSAYVHPSSSMSPNGIKERTPDNLESW